MQLFNLIYVVSSKTLLSAISRLTSTFIKLLEARCRWIIASGDVTFRYVYIDDDVLQHLMKFFEST